MASLANGTTINGSTAWHAGNDGSGSGLDADTLDGLQASAFALASHTHSYDNYGGWTLYTDGTNRGNISSGEVVNIIGGTNVSLGYSSTNNAITINSSDQYTGTVTSVTGGSYLTGGTITGSGTLAVDASTASTANKVVARDSSGDINARLFRSEYDTTNSTINYIMTQVDTASNNYIRPSTPAQLASALSGSTMNINGSSTSCTGNSATATWADTVDVNTSTSTSTYGILWNSGDTVYTTSNAKIRPSDSAIFAPIYYDINNTGYYMNPASTSNINAMNMAGDLTVNGGDIVLGGTGRIQGIDTVSASTDAVNKAYVDNALASAGGGATGGGSDEAFYENDQIITTSYTITAGKNAMTAGDVTINTGVTVTVPSGSRWVII